MKVVLIILGVLGLFVVAGYFVGTNGMNEIKNMPINDVALSNKADGVYQGEFHLARWDYSVEVEVKDGKIVAIKNLSSQPDAMLKLSAQVADTVIQKQKVNIDTYSAATIDSKAFLKAVENALTKAE